MAEAMIAKGAKPVNEVQVVNFDRRLPCPLTTAEVIQRAQTIKELRSQTAHLERRMTEEKEEFTRIKGEFDQARASIESEASKLRSSVEDLTGEIAEQSVHRDVRCQRVFDYRLMQVKELRMDRTPPEPLQESRPMTAREAEQGYTNDDGKRKGKSFEEVSQKDNTHNDEPESDDSGDEVDFD
jgi:predicted RNase H-like nuclease (RuvC/YqgF family)